MPMNLPDLYEESSSKVKTEVFAGLNRATRIGDGEFHDMQNLTSDEYPVLAVRPRRGQYFKAAASNFTTVMPQPYCLFTASPSDSGDQQICYLAKIEPGEGAKYGMVIGDSFIDLGLEGIEGRSVVRMGAYAIVLPDMVYVNTVDVTDYGPIEDGYENRPTDLRVTLSVVDSEGKSVKYTSTEQPTDDFLKNGDLWYRSDYSDEPDYSTVMLYRYNKDEGVWREEASYIEVSIWCRSESPHIVQAPGDFRFKKQLREGDVIRLKNVHDRVNGDHVIHSVKRRGDETRSFTIQGKLATATAISVPFSNEENPVRIERVIPKLDFACEAGNRIWGCRYENGTTDINEIYCSARGDFYRWIQGASDDPDAPVTFSIGTDGAWTGAVCYQGYPTFFKETCMHRVSGTGASGYALYDVPCVGVARGCEKSLAVVNNVLYYKSAGAVMAFDGSLPVPISEKLGRLTGYTHATGGACGEKYYLSLWKADGKDPVLYVLDTARGLWHKEDGTRAEYMASLGDSLYMSVSTGEERFWVLPLGNFMPKRIIKKIGGDGESIAGIALSQIPEGPVHWYAETGIIGMESDAAKYLSKISVRLAMDVGSTVRISVQYDSMGTFKQLMAVEDDRMKVVSLPILPVRCDHLRLRLEGTGGCRLFSLTKTFEAAEDL